MTNESILQEDITIFKVCVPSKKIKQQLIELQGQIDESSIIETSTHLYQKWTDPAGKK